MRSQRRAETQRECSLMGFYIAVWQTAQRLNVQTLLSNSVFSLGVSALQDPGFHLQDPCTHFPLLAHPVGTSFTHSSTHSRQLKLQNSGSNIGNVQLATFLLDSKLDRKLTILGFWVVCCHLKIFYYKKMYMIVDKITRKNICDPWCGSTLPMWSCYSDTATKVIWNTWFL